MDDHRGAPFTGPVTSPRTGGKQAWDALGSGMPR